MAYRTVFFISDGTGITAETFGNALLTQFELDLHRVRLPFVTSVEAAHQALRQINQAAQRETERPIVFTTVVDAEILGVLHQSTAFVLDLFSTFVSPLEHELGRKSNHRVGRFSDEAKSQRYHERMEAVNYALTHDDGQSHKDLEKAQIILVGVSRSGKTPTSLYLAMQHGLRAANYPLIPEDFERKQLPPALLPFRHKLFGLTIDPYRLAEIRHERRPGSRYASLENCQYEVAQAQTLMRREGIRCLSTTTKSVEEIATTILQEIRPEQLSY
jgi:regulator of PEP synthase PpsR (kinase-PPPase family)